MNKIIFLIILMGIFLYFIGDNFENNKIENKIEIPTEQVNDILSLPDFRGLINSKYITSTSEYGGIEQFQNIKLNDINLINNKINFKNYGSYRIKPYERCNNQI
jgi:hypothetical protein